jgi:hypothetical protein
MATWQADQACQQREKKTAEAALQQQLENTRLKRLEGKKKRDAERKQEEEQRKLAEVENRKDKEVADTEVTVVSPDAADPLINSHLVDMMQGDEEEDAADDGENQRSPAKSKQKSSTFAEAMASKPTIQPTAKSVERALTPINIPTRESL